MSFLFIIISKKCSWSGWALWESFTGESVNHRVAWHRKGWENSGDRWGNLRGQQEHLSRSTKEMRGTEWHSRSHCWFYVPAYGGRAALKQMTWHYHRNFLAGERLRRKLPRDRGGIQMLPARGSLTLAEIFNLLDCQVFIFHSLHLASHFIHSAKTSLKLFLFTTCQKWW